MTVEEKADKKSYDYNTKYSEDGKLKSMIVRPHCFVEGAIDGIVNIIKQKAYRDGYIAGAKENGIQIHKTTEFDFPENGSEVLCFGKMWNCTPYISILKYDDYFHDENGTPYDTEIKAWCENPFKE